MNKTIIINISGIIFHIEEDAYDLLKIYMSDVKKHFSKSEDSFEIVTDIENRIAEMFTAILTKENKQVIVLNEVERVIAQMGKISDFESEEISEDSFSEQTHSATKRLYRNPDDKILGGVCSGIAAYFGTDPLWIRLGLALSIVFFGTGILLYILLWIIMPEAKTRAEKLAMRGEKVTIETIKKSVEKELGDAKANFNGTDQIKGVIQNIVEAAGTLLKVLLKIFVKLIGLFLLFLGLSFGIAVIVLTLAGLGYIDAHVPGDFPLNIFEPGMHDIAFISWFVVCIVPVLALIMLSIRIVFNTKALNKTSALSLLGIWIFGVFTAGYLTVRTLDNFSEVGRLKQTTQIDPVKNNTYYLLTNKNPERYGNYTEDSASTRKYGLNGKVIVKSDGHRILFDNIDMSIERSYDDQMRLITIYSARGEDDYSAVQSAEAIEYKFLQEDSVLLFPNHFDLRKNTQWRDQKIKLTLLVPEQTKLIIDDRVDAFIHNISSWKCERNAFRQTSWIMNKDGLACKEEEKEADPVLQ